MRKINFIGILLSLCFMLSSCASSAEAKAFPEGEVFAARAGDILICANESKESVEKKIGEEGELLGSTLNVFVYMDNRIVVSFVDDKAKYISFMALDYYASDGTKYGDSYMKIVDKYDYVYPNLNYLNVYFKDGENVEIDFTLPNEEISALYDYYISYSLDDESLVDGFTYCESGYQSEIKESDKEDAESGEIKADSDDTEDNEDDVKKE